jgi:hypothetical protein
MPILEEERPFIRFRTLKEGDIVNVGNYKNPAIIVFFENAIATLWWLDTPTQEGYPIKVGSQFLRPLGA